MSDSDVFNLRIKQSRDKKGWSQAELARNAEITPAAVNQFEKGSRKPNMPILRKLAKVLDVSIDYLVGESDEENEVKVQNEWQEFYRGFSELTDKDREILKAQMDILKERSKSDNQSELIFTPMSKLLEFRQKCEDIAHSPSNGANVHKLAPLIEVISEVLSDPYYEHSPEDCGDHHIQDAIDCLRVAARHLIK